MVLQIPMDRALEMTQGELICWINDIIDEYEHVYGEE